MRTKTLHFSRIAIVAAAFLLLLPATALAGEDAQQLETQTQDEVAEVTLDDMTVDDAETQKSEEATAGEDYFGQEVVYPGLAASIGINALWGGVTGALIGTGVWLLGDFDAMDPWMIAQFAGGGILIGSVVGLASWLIWGETAEAPGRTAETNADVDADVERPASVDWVEQDTPDVYDIDLIRLGF